MAKIVPKILYHKGQQHPVWVWITADGKEKYFSRRIVDGYRPIGTLQEVKLSGSTLRVMGTVKNTSPNLKIYPEEDCPFNLKDLYEKETVDAE
jgi:hypothetical protein